MEPDQSIKPPLADLTDAKDLVEQKYGCFSYTHIKFKKWKFIKLYKIAQILFSLSSFV